MIKSHVAMVFKYKYAVRAHAMRDLAECIAYHDNETEGEKERKIANGHCRRRCNRCAATLTYARVRTSRVGRGWLKVRVSGKVAHPENHT